MHDRARAGAAGRRVTRSERRDGGRRERRERRGSHVVRSGAASERGASSDVKCFLGVSGGGVTTALCGCGAALCKKMQQGARYQLWAGSNDAGSGWQQIVREICECDRRKFWQIQRQIDPIARTSANRGAASKNARETRRLLYSVRGRARLAERHVRATHLRPARRPLNGRTLLSMQRAARAGGGNARRLSRP